MFGLPTTGRTAATGDSVWVAVIYIAGKGRLQPVSGAEAGFRWLAGRIAPDEWRRWSEGRDGVPPTRPENDREALTIRYGKPYRSHEKIFLDEYFFGDNSDGARVMHMLVIDKSGVDVFEQLVLQPHLLI